MQLPQIGLGTWELKGPVCTSVVKLALDLGYRHIDTAHAYQNHQDIGKAIQGFDRTQLYLTSKLAIDEEIDPKQIQTSVYRACERALKELNTEYLDLYLIHWPIQNFDLKHIFACIQKLQTQGKIKHAGVSNYTIHHLSDLRQAGLTPFANQVEFHPYLNQNDLLQYCQSHHIQLIAFRPFGKGKLLQEEAVFEKIGKKYHKTAAQVILRWFFQKLIPVVFKCSTREHLQENLKIEDFCLSEQEMQELNHLDKKKRYCKPDSTVYSY